jgi:hypothetical protein
MCPEELMCWSFELSANNHYRLSLANPRFSLAWRKLRILGCGGRAVHSWSAGTRDGATGYEVFLRPRRCSPRFTA